MFTGPFDVRNNYPGRKEFGDMGDGEEETPEFEDLEPVDGDSEPSEAEKEWLSEDEEDYEWMTRMDREILAILGKSNLVLTPSVIADNLERSRPAVSRRLGKLEEAGLVEKEGRGKYSISKRGSGFLSRGNWPPGFEL